MNDEKVDSTLKSTVLGTEDYNIHNRDSCLRGIPLSVLKHSLQLFSEGRIDSSQLLIDCNIAYRLHELQIPTEIKSVLLEKYPDEKDRQLLNPDKWTPNSFSRNMLITKTKDVIGILDDAIKKVNINEIPIVQPITKKFSTRI
ncbi:MAG: hypothetical protein NTY06_03795 [Candidatus Gottesmanbacteria bacterium]|nr:hypothetical protein [Candidatus Gottesmanbacteria bacterium]